jgi:hypothetical protein
MARHCENIEDPIMYENWCDIDPNQYIRKGIVGDRCYALGYLLMSLEGELERNPWAKPLDPFRNTVDDNVIILLCARHIMNGGELPPRLDAYVLRLIDEEGEALEEGAALEDDIEEDTDWAAIDAAEEAEWLARIAVLEAEAPVNKRARLEGFLQTYMPDGEVTDLVTTLLDIPAQGIRRSIRHALTAALPAEARLHDQYLLILSVVHTILAADENINRLTLITTYMRLYMEDDIPAVSRYDLAVRLIETDDLNYIRDSLAEWHGHNIDHESRVIYALIRARG